MISLQTFLNVRSSNVSQRNHTLRNFEGRSCKKTFANGPSHNAIVLAHKIYIHFLPNNYNGDVIKYSRGGNFLLNVGPASDGTIPPIMQERLLQLGEYLLVQNVCVCVVIVFCRFEPL